jgi:hypothetical protein
VGGGNGEAAEGEFSGVVGRVVRSLWLFTRTETQAAYWVRAIVQIGARENIYSARFWRLCWSDQNDWRFFRRDTIIVKML